MAKEEPFWNKIKKTKTWEIQNKTNFQKKRKKEDDKSPSGEGDETALKSRIRKVKFTISDIHVKKARFYKTPSLLNNAIAIASDQTFLFSPLQNQVLTFYILLIFVGLVLVRCQSNQVLTFYPLSHSGSESFKFSVLIRLLRDFNTDDESWVTWNYSALLSLCLFPYRFCLMSKLGWFGFTFASQPLRQSTTWSQFHVEEEHIWSHSV